MRLFLISDNRDTLVGMRLAGVKGVLVENQEQAEETLDKLLEDREVGIILVTEAIAGLIRERINFIKAKLSQPLIVEIPDRHGSNKDKNYILNYVKESIGIKI